jgi:dihydrofolate reductase
VRKIILQSMVSLDGYMEGPDRDLSWHLVDEELHRHFNQELAAMGTFIEGRVTFELMAQYWPAADQDPDAPAPIAEFASIWREMPKLVYSRTLEHADWSSTIVREVVPEEVEQLKAQPGGDMVMSGADLSASFMRYGLIDEFRIYVNPVVVGGGTPLFRPGTDLTALRLAETRAFGNGVVLLRYQRADDTES